MTVTDAHIALWVERLRREEPRAVAVLLKGSYARGMAGAYSDLDLDVLTAGEPAVRYPVYIEERPDGRLLHVSVAATPVEEWLAGEGEPGEWAFGLPSEETTRLLWAASPDLAARLDRPALLHPAGDPELEDFIADLGKVRAALVGGDELALRLAAQNLARLCPSVLRLVNAPVRPGAKAEALRTALGLAVVPSGYRDDMLLCLGLAGYATTGEQVYHAASRLVAGTVILLRPHAERLAPELPPHLAQYLADGTLDRYIDQLTADG